MRPLCTGPPHPAGLFIQVHLGFRVTRLGADHRARRSLERRVLVTAERQAHIAVIPTGGSARTIHLNRHCTSRRSGPFRPVASRRSRPRQASAGPAGSDSACSGTPASLAGPPSHEAYAFYVPLPLLQMTNLFRICHPIVANVRGRGLEAVVRDVRLGAAMACPAGLARNVDLGCE